MNGRPCSPIPILLNSLYQPLIDRLTIICFKTESFQAFWRYYADNPLKGRDVILSSVCNDLYQMYLVKLSLMLCLIGGVGDVSSTGTYIVDYTIILSV